MNESANLVHSSLLRTAHRRLQKLHWKHRKGRSRPGVHLIRRALHGAALRSLPTPRGADSRVAAPTEQLWQFETVSAEAKSQERRPESGLRRESLEVH